MTLEISALDLAAAGAVSIINRMSLHTANPGMTGANEVTGGGYTRQLVSWIAPSGSVSRLQTSPAVVFSGPPGLAVTHIGLWNGSTWVDSMVPTGTLVFNLTGTLRVAMFEVDAA